MTPGEIVLTCPSSAWKAYLVTQIRKKDRFLHLSAFLFFVNGRLEIITQVLLTSLTANGVNLSPVKKSFNSH